MVRRLLSTAGLFTLSHCGAPGAPAAPPSTPPPPPKVSVVRTKECVAEEPRREKARTLVEKEGRIDRALRVLAVADAHCPGEAGLSAVVRLRALVEIGRDPEAHTLASTLKASADPAERAAAADAEAKLANSPTVEEALARAATLATADPAGAQRLFDRARTALEAKGGASRIVELDLVDAPWRVRWGKHGIAVGDGRRVTLHTPESLAVTRVFDLGAQVWALAMAADWLVAAGEKRTVAWNLVTGDQRVFEQQGAPIALGGDGLLVTTGPKKASGPMGVTLTPLDGSAPPRVIAQGVDPIYRVSLSPDTRRVVLARVDDRKKALAYDTKTGAKVATLDFGFELESLLFGADSDRVYGGARRDLHWMLVSNPGKHVESHEAKRAVAEIALHPKGVELATAGTLTVRLWDAATFQSHNMEGSMKGHTNGISSVDYSTDGARLVTGSSDGSVRVWDPSKGKSVLSAHVARKQPEAVAISAKHLAVAFDELSLFDLLDGTRRTRKIDGSIRTLSLHGGEVLVAAKSLESLDAALAPRWSTPKVFTALGWDAAGMLLGQENLGGQHTLHTLDPASGVSKAQRPLGPIVLLSPNGRYGLIGGHKTAASGWLVDLSTKQTITAQALGREVAGSCFSLDGETLYVPYVPPGKQGPRNRIRAYESKSGKMLWEEKVDGDVSALALSTDGKTVWAGIVGESSGSVEAWDAASHTRSAKWAVDGEVRDLAVHGDRVVVTLRDRRVRLYGADGASLLSLTRIGEGYLIDEATGHAELLGTADRTRFGCAIATHVYPLGLCAERTLVADLAGRVLRGKPVEDEL